MLILTRRIGETIIIDKNVRITVLAAKGNQLRLGIDAPADVEIHREEIFNRIYGATQEGELANPERTTENTSANN